MMHKLTLEQAERKAIEAVASGDPDAMATWEKILDEIEAAERKPPVTLAQAALWYAEQSLKVFPLQSGLKIPYKGTRGFKDATDDTSQVAAWWQARPDSNIGIATGHLVDVVDIDGELGHVSRARNAKAFESLNVLGKVSTPRPGGMHLYVEAVPVDLADYVTVDAALYPGVDYRGRGGYVVAPPSVNADGKSYIWTRPLDLTGVEA